MINTTFFLEHARRDSLKLYAIYVLYKPLQVFI